MEVILKGELGPELTGLGLKPGDKVNGNLCSVSKVGCFHFEKYVSGVKIECSVWPENYVVVAKETTDEKHS